MGEQHSLDPSPRIEALLRELAPQVLGLLVHRYGGFDTCEDAVQEALLAAAVQWPSEGIPDHPKGWLFTVASRRRTELWRNEAARRVVRRRPQPWHHRIRSRSVQSMTR